MQQDQLYQTAIHEAGHGVVAALLGKKYKHINIIAKDEQNGCIRYWTARGKLLDQVQGLNNRIFSNSSVDKKVRREIKVSYAGYVAQLKTGVDDRDGAASDFDGIVDFACTHIGDGEETSLFLDECFEATKQIVDDNWQHITTVANMLIEKKILTGKEVIQIISGK